MVTIVSGKVDKAENEVADRLKISYKKVDARKQSRQVRICEKVPPSSNKRSWDGGNYNVSNTKSNLTKKTKLGYLKRREEVKIALWEILPEHFLLKKSPSILNQYSQPSTKCESHMKILWLSYQP